MLVGVRILLLRQRPPAAAGAARAHSVVGARAVRGRRRGRGAHIVRLYRRPRPVGRVPVHPRRDQVPRDAHAARRHAARVPRVLPVDDAVLLQPVAVRGARGACRRCCWSASRSTCCRRRQATQMRPFAPRAALRRSAVMILQGLPIAILLFVLFPRLAAPLWGLPTDYSAKTGLSDSMSPGEISDLSLSDAVAFRVEFDGARPAQSRPLLARTRVLAVRRPQVVAGLRESGRRPCVAPATGDHRTPSRSSPTTGTRCSRSTCPRRLPTLRRQLARCAVAATRASRATSRSSLLAARRDDGRSTRSARCCARPIPRRPRNDARGESRARRRQRAHDRRSRRELRDAVPGRPRATSARSSASSTTRSTSTRSRRRSTSRIPSTCFLFDERRGFCEHYASAFVVMLRAAGIPARVVTGYQGGTINPRGDYMIVRQSDAHAWAEALIDGEWQRFDPTAAVSPSRIEIGLGGALPRRRAAAVPRASRRHLAHATCSSRGMRSTTTGGATSSASTATASAALWRDWRARPDRAAGKVVALVGAVPLRVGRARRRLAHVEAPPPGTRARAVGRSQPQARARRTAAPSVRRSARFRDARGGALAAIRDRIRGDRRVVRGAALRRGRRRARARCAGRHARAGDRGAARAAAALRDDMDVQLLQKATS